MKPTLYKESLRGMARLLAAIVLLSSGNAQSADSEGAQLATALQEQRAGNIDKAIALYREILQRNPKSAETHNWLGVAFAEKSNLIDAIAEFRKSVALDPKLARAWTNLGSALARSGEVQESVRAFGRALECNRDDPASHMNLAVALRANGDTKGAVEHLRYVAAKRPEDAGVQYELGQTLRQAGNTEVAVEAFETALQINPELREGYYNLGVTLKQIAAARRPPNSPARSPGADAFERAQQSSARGDLKAAKEQLEQALQADTGYAEAHNLLGFILGQERDLKGAIEQLHRAIELRPDYAEAHYNLGVALWYSGEQEKAVGEFRESTRLDAAAGQSYAFLGTALEGLGDLGGARRNLMRAIALLPPLPSVFVDLGIVFLRSHDVPHTLAQFEAALNLPDSSSPRPAWERAADGLRQVMAKDGKDPEAHNILGRLMGRAGADSQAIIAEFREAIRLRPDFADAQNNLGLVLAQANEDEAAIAAFREAIRLAPTWADAHANLGATLVATDPISAMQELEKAIQLDPSSVKAQYNLALAYGASAENGVNKEIEQLRKVIAAAPDFARAYVALGRALLESGNVSGAIDPLQQAVRLDPSLGEAHYQLGLALSRAGRKADAMPELQKGREIVASDERTQNFALDVSEGRAALDRGEADQAIAKFRRALSIQPASGVANRLLGMALAKQGDSKGSVVAFRKALEIDPEDSVSKHNLERLLKSAEPVDNVRQMEISEGYIREAKFQQAESLLNDYVSERPNSSWGWYALGYSQFGQKKIGLSIQSLAKSLQLNVKNAEAHKILGRDLMIIGRFDAARIEFEEGIRLSPQSAELYYDLGKLLSIDDNWEPAKREFENAVRLDPSYVEAWDALGFATESLGDDSGAVADYDKAIRLNEARKGRFASAHVNLSAFYNRSGMPEKALEYAKAALELNPQNDRAWFQMAKAQERRGELQAAVDSANHAVQLNSRASSYYYVLATLYRRLGRTDESARALEQFTRLDRESNALDKKRRDSGSQQTQAKQLPGPAKEGAHE
jgi:tetratricopeptide (TPR) repeat protein